MLLSLANGTVAIILLMPATLAYKILKFLWKYFIHRDPQEIMEDLPTQDQFFMFEDSDEFWPAKDSSEEEMTQYRHKLKEHIRRWVQDNDDESGVVLQAEFMRIGKYYCRNRTLAFITEMESLGGKKALFPDSLCMLRIRVSQTFKIANKRGRCTRIRACDLQTVLTKQEET